MKSHWNTLLHARMPRSLKCLPILVTQLTSSLVNVVIILSPFTDSEYLHPRFCYSSELNVNALSAIPFGDKYDGITASR